MSQDLCSRVELKISCRDLEGKDLLSKSDPSCRVWLGDVNEGEKTLWKPLGITEMIKNEDDPIFKKTFMVTYHFEEQQPLRFELYDIDSSDFDPEAEFDEKEHDFLGSLECLLSEICTRKHFEKPLEKCKKGSIQISHVEVAADAHSQCKLLFEGEGLAAVDTFGGSSDPYFRLTTLQGAKLYESEVLDNCLDPVFYPAVLTLHELCGGDRDKTLRFTCFDKGGLRDKEIGSFDFSVNLLKRQKRFELLLNGKLRGVMKCKYREVKKFSFFDYIQEGTEIGLVCAIDFTKSNGDVKHEKSLHYVDPAGKRLNDYENAILQIGKILASYERSGVFPLYGFGGVFPGKSGADHCKLINGGCKGVDGLLGAYHEAIKGGVELSGPTYLAGIVREVRSKFACGQWQNGWCKKYTILLVITDGTLDDMDQTKREIIEAANQAMSILLVGVGDEDFSGMRELDADEENLRCGGKEACRDICHFTNFTFLKRKGAGVLAKKVLEEIPNHVGEFFDMNNRTKIENEKRDEIRRIEQKRSEIKNRAQREREEIERQKREEKAEKERIKAEERAKKEKIKAEERAVKRAEKEKEERIKAEEKAAKRAEKEKVRMEKKREQDRIKAEKQRKREAQKREKLEEKRTERLKKRQEKERREYMKIPVLIRMVMEKNVGEVRRLVKEGKVDVNVEDKHGKSALHYACVYASVSVGGEVVEDVVARSLEIIDIILGSARVDPNEGLDVSKYSPSIRMRIRKSVGNASRELDTLVINDCIQSTSSAGFEDFKFVVKDTKRKLNKVFKLPVQGKEFLLLTHLSDQGPTYTPFAGYLVENTNVDINKKDARDLTAVYYACKHNNGVLLELLLKHNADSTVLSKRFSEFSREMKKRVRKLGVKGQKIDKYCLQMCLEQNDIDFFHEIIANSDFNFNKKKAFNYKSMKALTLFQRLCIDTDQSKSDFIRGLVNTVKGINFSQLYPDGRPPLYHLAHNKSMQLLELCFKKGAAPEEMLKFSGLYDGCVRKFLRVAMKFVHEDLDSYAIYDSVKENDLEYFKQLIQNTKLNLNKPVGGEKTPLLIWLVLFPESRKAFVEVLLKASKKVNVSKVDSNGFDSLYHAIMGKTFDLELLTLLSTYVKQGRWDSVVPRFGDIPYAKQVLIREKFFGKKNKIVNGWCLVGAIENADFTTFAQVLECFEKSSLKKLKVADEYVIHKTVKSEGKLKFLKELLKKKVKIDVRDKEDNTPLEVALVRENMEIANLLMEAGADVTKVEFEKSNNDSILHYYAAQDSKVGIVKFIAKRYPKLKNEKNSLKLTPIQVAYRAKAFENFKAILATSPKQKHKYRVLMASINEKNVKFFRAVVKDSSIEVNKKIKFKDQGLKVYLLHYLINRNVGDLVEALLQERSDVDVDLKVKKLTPLEVCVNRSCAAIFFEALLKRKPKIAEMSISTIDRLMTHLCKIRAENALIELMILFEDLIQKDDHDNTGIRNLVQSHLSSLFKMSTSGNLFPLAVLIVSFARKYAKDSSLLDNPSLLQALLNGVQAQNDELIKEILSLLSGRRLRIGYLNEVLVKCVDNLKPKGETTAQSISIFSHLLGVFAAFSSELFFQQVNRIILEKKDSKAMEVFLERGTIGVNGCLRSAVSLADFSSCKAIISHPTFLDSTDEDDYLFALDVLGSSRQKEQDTEATALRDSLLSEKCVASFSEGFDDIRWAHFLRIVTCVRDVKLLRAVLAANKGSILREGAENSLKFAIMFNDVGLMEELFSFIIEGMKSTEEKCELSLSVLRTSAFVRSFDVFSSVMKNEILQEKQKPSSGSTKTWLEKEFDILMEILIAQEAPWQLMNSFLQLCSVDCTPAIDKMLVLCVNKREYFESLMSLVESQKATINVKLTIPELVNALCGIISEWNASDEEYLDTLYYLVLDYANPEQDISFRQSTKMMISFGYCDRAMDIVDKYLLKFALFNEDTQDRLENDKEKLLAETAALLFNHGEFDMYQKFLKTYEGFKIEETHILQAISGEMWRIFDLMINYSFKKGGFKAPSTRSSGMKKKKKKKKVLPSGTHLLKISEEFQKLLSKNRVSLKKHLARFKDFIFDEVIFSVNQSSTAQVWNNAFRFLVEKNEIDTALDVLVRAASIEDLFLASSANLLSFLSKMSRFDLTSIFGFVLESHNLAKVCKPSELKVGQIAPVITESRVLRKSVFDIIMQHCGQLFRADNSYNNRIMNHLKSREGLLKQFIDILGGEKSDYGKSLSVDHIASCASELWVLNTMLDKFDVQEKYLLGSLSTYANGLDAKNGVGKNMEFMAILQQVDDIPTDEAMKLLEKTMTKKNFYVFREIFSKSSFLKKHLDRLYDLAFTNRFRMAFDFIVTKGGNSDTHTLQDFVVSFSNMDDEILGMLETFVSKNRRKLFFSLDVNLKRSNPFLFQHNNNTRYMETLLKLRVASIYDCDLSGRTILHYKPHKEKLKFFIENYPKCVVMPRKRSSILPKVRFFNQMEVEDMRGQMKLLDKKIKSIQTTIVIEAHASGLPKMDAGPLGKCDAYFTVEAGVLQLAKSEVVKRTYTPTWSKLDFTLPHGLSIFHPLVFKVWDWDRKGEDDYVGCFEIVIDNVVNGGMSKNFEIVDWRNKLANRGKFHFKKLVIVEKEVTIDNPRRMAMEKILKMNLLS